VAGEKKDLRALSENELSEALKSMNEPAFRLKQLNEWLWKKGARSVSEMTNLSKSLREKLNEHFTIYASDTDLKQQSHDGTIKLRFKTFDNHSIEGVLIPSPQRLTACVSSQAGCSLTCSFCATGQLKYKRNLRFDEIFDQVVLLNQEAQKHFNRALTNIVFMGMGEPLLNYSQVMKAIEKISSPDSLGISPRRITVSTAGIAKMIKKLGDDGVRFRLALSLHAADDKKRSSIMPINDQNNLESLMEALEYFDERTHSRISFEYILFQKFNDGVEDARKLVQLANRVSARINLIEFNPIGDSHFKKSSADRMQFFHDYLTNHGVNVTIRHSRGKDIDAACGQLANKTLSASSLP
jgi:23S rRNA (adenine2503-C2)-methyltransferase